MSCGARLVAPSEKYWESYLTFRQESLRAGDRSFEGTPEKQAFFAGVERYAQGGDLPAGHVRQNRYWLVRGREVIGQSQLRHALTDGLRREGGNIGYSIRPKEWRKGYGALLLSLTLQKAKELGLERVLLTTDPGNIGSQRIIEKNGGVLDPTEFPDSKPKRRYWIEL